MIPEYAMESRDTTEPTATSLQYNYAGHLRQTPINLHIHTTGLSYVCHFSDRKSCWATIWGATGQVLDAGWDPPPTWGQMLVPQEVSLPDICVRRKLI